MRDFYLNHQVVTSEILAVILITFMNTRKANFTRYIHKYPPQCVIYAYETYIQIV